MTKYKNSDVSYASIHKNRQEPLVFLEHHQPTFLDVPYHFHASIEVNLLQECDMIYSFSGKDVFIKRNQICVFWAAYPHRVSQVIGTGMITNAHVSLSEFLLWPLPSGFVNALLGGAVIGSIDQTQGDQEMVSHWSREVGTVDLQRQRLHALEVQARLYRMALDGFETLLPAVHEANRSIFGGAAIPQFEKMVRFIAHYYADSIKISDVAKEAGVTVNYAINLFKKMLGRTVKEHITDIRLFHAKMLLLETDEKILTISLDSGFNSLSAFYEAFHNHVGVSPAVFRTQHGRYQNEER